MLFIFILFPPQGRLTLLTVLVSAFADLCQPPNTSAIDYFLGAWQTNGRTDFEVQNLLRVTHQSGAALDLQ